MANNDARASSNAQASTSGQHHPHISPKEVSPNYDYVGPNDYQMDLILHQVRSFVVQLLCSGGSGALAKTAVAPLERAKVLVPTGSHALARASRTSMLLADSDL